MVIFALCVSVNKSGFTQETARVCPKHEAGRCEGGAGQTQEEAISLQRGLGFAASGNTWLPCICFCVSVCARARVSVCARVARLPTRQALVASVRTSKLLAHLLLSVGR